MEKRLSFIYLSQGFTIYPHRQLIARGEENIQVRSKTFALLLLLLEKPREVLSKRYLLDKIWDDVTVEEQVLVQSVRELRQLFGSAEIIQTYPRKGYAWAADVDKQLVDEAKPDTIVAQPLTTAAFSSHKNIYKKIVIGLGLMVALVVIVLLMQSYRATSPAKTEVVIILPMKNQVAGIDHNWVPLGAMDQLNHLLISNQNVQVMSSEYVLLVMSYAKLSRDYDTQQVARIFDVSGASLIVESQLSGSVENYRLDYKLRYKNDVKRGAIFDKDLNQAIYKLGQLISGQTGQKLHDADNNAQALLTNELMARALEKLDLHDLEAAENLFISLKQLEPNNLIARQKLIATLIKLKKFSQAKEEIDATLQLIGKDNPQELTKIYFLLAVLDWQQGAIDDALQMLEQTDHFAAISSDIYYQANIAQIRGYIQQERGNYGLAQAAFEQSMKFDNLIRCPIGISDNHIKLAKIFSLQGKRDLALQHYNEAKNLIETNQYTDMLPELEAVNPLVP